LEWIHPEIPVAHPLMDGSAAAVHRSLEETVNGLGEDGQAYGRLLEPLVAQADDLLAEILAPVHVPQHPWILLRFGLAGVRSARRLAHKRFRTERARGMLAGMAAHSVLPLEHLIT